GGPARVPARPWRHRRGHAPAGRRDREGTGARPLRAAAGLPARRAHRAHRRDRVAARLLVPVVSGLLLVTAGFRARIRDLEILRRLLFRSEGLVLGPLLGVAALLAVRSWLPHLRHARSFLGHTTVVRERSGF